MTETVQTTIESIAAVLIVIGALLCALSSFGLIRLPDFYTRLHAAGKSSTLGAVFILGGACLFFMARHQPTSVKMLLALIFLFVTAPVASHMIGRAAYRTGVPLSDRTVRDELKEEEDARKRPGESRPG